MVFVPPHQLATIFGILGNIVSFMVFLAPMRTFYKIYKKKCTEGFQSIPYSVALFSCTLLLYYGFLKTSGGLMIITINSIGCVIEAIYLGIFLIYSPKDKKAQTIKFLCGFNLAVYGGICLTTYLSFHGPVRVTIVGWICAIFSVMVFAAPLSVMRRVLRTKSVEYMPFGLSLSLTVCAVMWFSYGMLIQDYYIALPNVLGFSFGIVQMIIYGFYRNASKKVLPDQQKTTAETDIELANANTEQEQQLDEKPATPKSPDHAINIFQEQPEHEVVDEVECETKMDQRAVVAEPERIIDIHHPIPVMVNV